MALIFDAAYRPSLAAVKAAGGIAMSYYLTGDYAHTCARAPELHAAGLGALGNYERAASELAWCGYGRGVEIGHEAAYAMLGDGAPPGQGLGVAASVDVNVDPSNFHLVADAFRGIKAGLGGRFALHAYSEGALIDYLATRALVAGVQWLAAPTSWPGFNPASVRVGMTQRVGTPVPGTDYETISHLSELGIWWPTGSPYAPRPAGHPAPRGMESTMIIVKQAKQSKFLQVRGATDVKVLEQAEWEALIEAGFSVHQVSGPTYDLLRARAT